MNPPMPPEMMAELSTSIRAMMPHKRLGVWLSCVALLCLGAFWWRQVPLVLFWMHPIGGLVVIVLLVVLVVVPFWTGYDTMRRCLRCCAK